MTQADVDAGSIVNTATVTGLDPANAPTSATGGATVTADQTAGAVVHQDRVAHERRGRR